MPCARCLVSNVLGTTEGSKLFNPTGQPSFLNGRLLNVSWEESSEVTKVPLAESRRLIVMESKLSECMERKDRKKMVKCREK